MNQKIVMWETVRGETDWHVVETQFQTSCGAAIPLLALGKEPCSGEELGAATCLACCARLEELRNGS